MVITDPSSEARSEKPSGRRHLLFSVLCIFSWVYYGIMASLFLIALLYSGWISDVINQYIPDNTLPSTQVPMIFLGLFVLHATAFTGIIFLWNLRPFGYYLFSVPTIIITVFHLFRPEISWLSTALYTVLIFLFAFFYRDLKKGQRFK